MVLNDPPEGEVEPDSALPARVFGGFEDGVLEESLCQFLHGHERARVERDCVLGVFLLKAAELELHVPSAPPWR